MHKKQTIALFIPSQIVNHLCGDRKNHSHLDALLDGNLDVLMSVSMTLVTMALKLPGADQDHVHQLLQGVDEEEPGQHQDLRDGQTRVREGAMLQTDLKNLRHCNIEAKEWKVLQNS